MDLQIIKNVSRYVVPIYYEYKDDGYSKIVESFLNDKNDYRKFGLPKECGWIETGFWKNYKSNNIDDQPEMDIYIYLLDMLQKGNSDLNEANLGTSFVLKSEGGNLIPFVYVPDKESHISFKCTDLGVVLFRNGIGFIWYNIEFGKNVTVEQYIDFQHDYKELARTNSDVFRHKTGKDTYDTICMGKWLAQVINTSEKGISFWASRKTNTKDEQEIFMPDKALLFQYLYIKETDQKTRKDLAFAVANGYDSKYDIPIITSSEVYEPFGNACAYASKSGMAYVVSDSQTTNNDFWKNNFAKKFTSDYFFIYMLLLYQTYSCAHFSRLLTRLPAEELVLMDNKEYIDEVRILDAKINLFLVKSTYELVSNIQHQNGTYIYGKKVLRIEEDIKSLTAGLTALREFAEEKQKKDEQARIDKRNGILNWGVTIFGLLGLISFLDDGMDLVDWCYNEEIIKLTAHKRVAEGIVLLTLAVIVMFLWPFFDWVISHIRRICHSVKIKLIKKGKKHP